MSDELEKELGRHDPAIDSANGGEFALPDSVLTPDFLAAQAQHIEARARYVKLANDMLDIHFGEGVRAENVQSGVNAVMVAACQMGLEPGDLPLWLKPAWWELREELADVWKAEEDAKARNAESGYWHVDTLNRDFRARVDGGDGLAILEVISTVGRWGKEVPDWLLLPLAEAIDTYLENRVRTLDEAFGVMRPKGFHVLHANRQLRHLIRKECIVLRNCGAAVGDALFELVAARHGIGKTLAKEFYYKPDPPPSRAEHEKSPNYREVTLESLKPELRHILLVLRPDLAPSAKSKK